MYIFIRFSSKKARDIEKIVFGCEKDTTKQDELANKLDEYIEHVKEHFANEERLMLEYNFPSYEMHKLAHDMFLINLRYATKKWKEFGDINKIINKVT
jgi:hemerythrin